MANPTISTDHAPLRQPSAVGEAVLARFSRGELDRGEAMRALGVDYGTLLLRLSERGLPLPSLPSEEIDRMAEDFLRVWRASREP